MNVAVSAAAVFVLIPKEIDYENLEKANKGIAEVS